MERRQSPEELGEGREAASVLGVEGREAVAGLGEEGREAAAALEVEGREAATMGAIEGLAMRVELKKQSWGKSSEETRAAVAWTESPEAPTILEEGRESINAPELPWKGREPGRDPLDVDREGEVRPEEGGGLAETGW